MRQIKLAAGVFFCLALLTTNIDCVSVVIARSGARGQNDVQFNRASSPTNCVDDKLMALLEEDLRSFNIEQTGTIGDNELNSTSLLGPESGSYDKGARLGYTIGTFVGRTASRRWSNPFDSCPTGESTKCHSEKRRKSSIKAQVNKTQLIENAFERLVFVRSNRIAFEAAVAKVYRDTINLPINKLRESSISDLQIQEAKLGSEVGGEAGSEAVITAVSELLNLSRPRSLSPRSIYSAKKIRRYLQQVRYDLFDSSTDGTTTKTGYKQLKDALECGRRFGSVMGAIVGLIVSVEAREVALSGSGGIGSVKQVKLMGKPNLLSGSTEFENFRLGAQRGYELAQTWTYLNQTSSEFRDLENRTTDELSSGIESTETILREQSVVNYMLLPAYNSTLRLTPVSLAKSLKIRPSTMDPILLADMKLQTGDLTVDDKASLPHGSNLIQLDK